MVIYCPKPSVDCTEGVGVCVDDMTAGRNGEWRNIKLHDPSGMFRTRKVAVGSAQSQVVL